MQTNQVRLRRAGEQYPSCHKDMTDQTAYSFINRSRGLRGKVGFLRDMQNMPFDIIAEIATHLQPLDLLHLARSSKPFRSLLMSCSSKYLWRSARKNVEGLPPCPPHLSEPAYANLAFSAHCHKCLKKNIKTILWKFSARYCALCKDSMVVPEKSLQWSERTVLVLHNRMEWLNTITRSAKVILFHLPEIQQVTQDWLALTDDSEETWKQFSEQRMARIRQIDEHVRLCESWSENRSVCSRKDSGEIKRHRMEAILSKLFDAGFGETIDRRVALCSFDHPLMRKSCMLSESEWYRIRGELTAHLRYLRNTYSASTRSKRFFALRPLLSAIHAAPRSAVSDFMPRLIDIATMPEVATIFNILRPTGITIFDTHMIRDNLPYLFCQWRKSMKKDLQRIMAATVGSENLYLAIAYFECCHCHRLLRYPNIMAHTCPLIAAPNFHSVTSAGEVFVDERSIILGKCGGWSSQSFRVSPAIEHIKHIVRLCGKEPDWTVEQRMDDYDARLCWYFPESPGIRRVVTWRGAVEIEHARASGSAADSEKPIIWRSTYWHEKKAVHTRQAELGPRIGVASEQTNIWCCALCDSHEGRHKSMQEIGAHIHNIHGARKRDKEGEDIYMHLDGQPCAPKPILLYPENLDARDALVLLTQEEQLFQEYRACACPSLEDGSST